MGLPACPAAPSLLFILRHNDLSMYDMTKTINQPPWKCTNCPTWTCDCQWQKWSREKSFSVPLGYYATLTLLFSPICRFWMWSFLILASTESNFLLGENSHACKFTNAMIRLGWHLNVSVPSLISRVSKNKCTSLDKNRCSKMNDSLWMSQGCLITIADYTGYVCESHRV